MRVFFGRLAVAFAFAAGAVLYYQEAVARREPEVTITFPVAPDASPATYRRVEAPAPAVPRALGRPRPVARPQRQHRPQHRS